MMRAYIDTNILVDLVLARQERIGSTRLQRYEILSENKKGFARKMQNPTIENIIGFLLPCPLAVVGLTTT